MGRGQTLAGLPATLRSGLIAVSAVLLSLAASGTDGVGASALAVGSPFIFNFAGNPSAPQPWTPSNWDVVVHSRDTPTFAKLEGMQAQHGADCAPYPATHFNSSYDGAVFICRNHLMTAINAHGYGEIVLTPDQLVDFSNRPATISFDLSTLRTSLRDWIDIWVTPIDDNLVLPLNLLTVDLQGPPAQGVQIKMDNFHGTVFRAFQFDNFRSREIPSNESKSLDKLLAGQVSAVNRTSFQLTISSNHVVFGAPKLGYNWIDAPLKGVTWTRALVQLAHHSYNPTKDCALQGLPTCAPNTWHWSSFSISNAVPFTMLRGTPQVVNGATPGLVSFPASAPANSFLRFAAIGTIDVSFDGGKTWQPARRQPQLYNYAEHFSSYWTPVPAGTASVTIRGHKWFAGPWWVRDVAIWSTTPPTTSTAPVGNPAPASPRTLVPALASASSSVPPAIGVGAVAAGVIVLGAGYWWLRRRRPTLGRRTANRT